MLTPDEVQYAITDTAARAVIASPDNALVAHGREHLAACKVPRGIQFVDSVPLTSSGKMMRRLLKDFDDGSLAIE